MGVSCAVNRIVISGLKSGSGKTTVTCGLIRAFMNRGLKVSARKCGPDYIDPMFHRTALKVPTGNLDTYFTDAEVLRYLLASGCGDSDITVIEGAMGYYDGLGGTSTRASTYEVASCTGSPAVLVIDVRGVSVTAAAVINGVKSYRENNNIRGVILNRVSAGFYDRLKGVIEEECGIRVFGYIETLSDFSLKSRHLGLVQPMEIEKIEQKLDMLAERMEKTVDIDGLLEISQDAEELPVSMPEGLKRVFEDKRLEKIRESKPLIAIAGDEAFTFCYDDNLRLISELGASYVFFSPLTDKKLPEGISGIILYGGYPENYADILSDNREMRECIRNACMSGMPVIAECGGFMYLNGSLTDMEGNEHKMCSYLKGRVTYSGRLVRFGYIEATAERDGLYGKRGTVIRAHEFHHFDCSDNGDGFTARKPLSDVSYSCIVHTDTLAAGFPHIYAYGNPEIYVNYLCRATEWKK